MQVLCFGRNEYGQLGNKSTSHQSTPIINEELSRKLIKQFDAGLHFSLYVSENGELFTWGYNVYGQLGLGDEGMRSAPTQVKFFADKGGVKRVRAGYDHVVAEAGDGNVYVWGYNAYGQLGLGDSNNRSTPQLLQFFKDKIISQIVVTGNHNFVLLENGEIYTWGKNDYGQCGVSATTVNKPEQLTFFSDKHVKRLFTGGFHSMAITETGELYVWGCNNNGQLGLNDVSHRSAPTLNTFFNDKPIKDIALGYYYSAVLLETGDFYVFGENNYGQLGLGDNTNKSTPNKHAQFSNLPVKSFALGDGHTVVLTDTNEVYVTGNNNTYQLGLGNTTNISLPTKLTLQTSIEIQAVYLKGFHTFLFSSPINMELDMSARNSSTDLSGLFSSLKTRLVHGVEIINVDDVRFNIYRFIVNKRCPILLNIIDNPSLYPSLYNQFIVNLLVDYTYSDTADFKSMDESKVTPLLDLYYHLALLLKQKHNESLQRLEKIILHKLVHFVTEANIGSIANKVEQLIGSDEECTQLLNLRNSILAWMKAEGQTVLKKASPEQRELIPQNYLLMVITGENIDNLDNSTIPASTLQRDIATLYDNPDHADVILVLDPERKRQVYAHKAVLQLRLPNYFNTSFMQMLDQQEEDELPANEEEPEMALTTNLKRVNFYEVMSQSEDYEETSTSVNIEEFVRYLYSGLIQVTPENAVELLFTWTKLMKPDFQDFKRQCEVVIIHNITSPESFFDVIQLFDKYDQDYNLIKQKCVDWCVGNWDSLHEKYTVEEILQKISDKLYIEINARRRGFRFSKKQQSNV